MDDKFFKVVVMGLVNALPDFALFWDTHFELVEETTLVPSITGEGVMSFPVKLSIKRKDLTRDNKLQYYRKDLELWDSMEYVGEQSEEG